MKKIAWARQNEQREDLTIFTFFIIHPTANHRQENHGCYDEGSLLLYLEGIMELYLPDHPVVDGVKEMFREQLLLEGKEGLEKYPGNLKLSTLYSSEQWGEKFNELWDGIDPRFQVIILDTTRHFIRIWDNLDNYWQSFCIKMLLHCFREALKTTQRKIMAIQVKKLAQHTAVIFH